jgi:GTPase SAR1 family protein
MEVPQSVAGEEDASNGVACRPGILIVGSKDVGKRTILNRLIADKDSEIVTSSATEASCHGWTINTKYYTADVCVWMACLNNPELNDGQQLQSLVNGCEALVMVFDLSNVSTRQLLRRIVECQFLVHPFGIFRK